MAARPLRQPPADDPVKVDPKHYKVEFENERVRVVRIKYRPDGKTEDISAKAGEVLHMDAFTHLPESTSKKPFELIQVELKG